MKGWALVLIAAVLEVSWVIGLKHSTEWWQWILTIGAIVFTFKLLLDAGQYIPVGTVYAVFVGLGTAGTVIADIVLFNGPIEWIKMLFIGILLIGVIGIKLVTDDKEAKE